MLPLDVPGKLRERPVAARANTTPDALLQLGFGTLFGAASGLGVGQLLAGSLVAIALGLSNTFGFTLSLPRLLYVALTYVVLTVPLGAVEVSVVAQPLVLVALQHAPSHAASFMAAVLNRKRFRKYLNAHASASALQTGQGSTVTSMSPHVSVLADASRRDCLLVTGFITHSVVRKNVIDFSWLASLAG